MDIVVGDRVSLVCKSWVLKAKGLDEKAAVMGQISSIREKAIQLDGNKELWFPLSAIKSQTLLGPTGAPSSASIPSKPVDLKAIKAPEMSDETRAFYVSLWREALTLPDDVLADLGMRLSAKATERAATKQALRIA